jgi:hypothetical protein
MWTTRRLPASYRAKSRCRHRAWTKKPQPSHGCVSVASTWIAPSQARQRRAPEVLDSTEYSLPSPQNRTRMERLTSEVLPSQNSWRVEPAQLELSLLIAREVPSRAECRAVPPTSGKHVLVKASETRTPEPPPLQEPPARGRYVVPQRCMPLPLLVERNRSTGTGALSR